MALHGNGVWVLLKTCHRNLGRTVIVKITITKTIAPRRTKTSSFTPTSGMRLVAMRSRLGLVEEKAGFIMGKKMSSTGTGAFWTEQLGSPARARRSAYPQPLQDHMDPTLYVVRFEEQIVAWTCPA